MAREQNTLGQHAPSLWQTLGRMQGRKNDTSRQSASYTGGPGGVAQSEEQRTFNPCVVGSNPTALTNSPGAGWLFP